MKKAITTAFSTSDKKHNRLKRSIEKKTKILEELMEKVESLKIELDFIAHEYNVRIGALLLKDNQLDMELLQLKNLKELIKGGMTYQKAMKHEEDAFYAEVLRMQAEQEKLDEERKVLEDIQDVSEDVMQEIKVIWKKLIRMFHPDLVVDPSQKTMREEMMKKINKAYAERNLEALRAFEETQDIATLTSLSVEELENQLIRVENSLRDAQGELNVLQHSTWFEWKKKKENTKNSGKEIDIFAELEQKFLDDIVKKIEIVQELRKEVHGHTSS